LVYVFGIEGVPLFEMLFIVIILLFAGLIFILLELRKLTKLISEEKTDIDRFEQDLAKFEGESSAAPSDELMTYIRNARASNLTDAQIEQVLVKQGWSKGDVDALLKKA